VLKSSTPSPVDSESSSEYFGDGGEIAIKMMPPCSACRPLFEFAVAVFVSGFRVDTHHQGYGLFCEVVAEAASALEYVQERCCRGSS
jgi:hypothetical protein